MPPALVTMEDPRDQVAFGLCLELGLKAFSAEAATGRHGTSTFSRPMVWECEKSLYGTLCQRACTLSGV